MKKIFLTFAILFTFSFATAQTVTVTDFNGQTIYSNQMYKDPAGGPNPVTGTKLIEYYRNSKWASYVGTTKEQPSSATTQQPTIVVVQLSAPQPSAYEQAVIENIKADTQQKKAGTFGTYVATGVNAYVALRTDARNERMTNAYLYNGVSNGYHSNVHGTGLSTNYVINNYSPDGNNAWSSNLGGAQPIMPQTYGWCR